MAVVELGQIEAKCEYIEAEALEVKVDVMGCAPKPGPPGTTTWLLGVVDEELEMEAVSGVVSEEAKEVLDEKFPLLVIVDPPPLSSLIK